MLTNPLGTFRNFRNRGGMISRQARISQTFRPNSLCFARVGSEHAEIPLSTAPRPDMLVLGCFEALQSFTSNAVDDGTGGATDAVTGRPQMVQIRPGIADNFATGTGAHQILAKHVDQPCFAFDDNTLYIDDLNGTLPFAGFVDAVNPKDGTVSLRMGEDQRVLYELYAAVGAPGAAKTSDDTVNYVITNLPAGAFANGVFTVTANGAMPTQDTNITPAVGDKAIFPVGTLTTQAVSAANSGVYECTAAGGASAQAVWTRSAKWQNGATITPGTKIKVSGANAASTTPAALWAGTTWSARPVSSAKVVGTDDPQLMPDRVVVPITLAASTFSITTVPIAAHQTVGVSCALTGGTPIAGTVGYGTLAAPTPGGVGTGTVAIDALASGMTKNGTTDTSTLNVTITQ